ncbi:syntaxin-4 [Carcharodon carcharias]|uniref:syntaxin-4 n=1 Tax=Carcharodon carcharias TaxID=13397 RepID=UPI001B7F6E2F|nr:syntaxin-4 [Carcharodon carcharias]
MRDRTKDLRKDEEVSDDEEFRLVIRDGDDPQDAFFQQVKDLREGIGKLKGLVKEMETIQLRILSSPIPEDRHRTELQSLREEIKTVASRVRNQLKGIEPTKSDEDQEAFLVEARMRRTQHGVLSRDFVEVMNSCYLLQSHYRDRNVERIQRQLKITGVQISEEKMEEMLESGQHEVFTANLMQDTKVTKQTLNEIESRHTEIKRLEKSIIELHEMFMYLAMEVEAQGETIDNIENNISKSVNYVEKAADNMAAAVVSKKKARKKKFCVIICVSVLVLVIIAIIVAVAYTT